MRSSESPQGAGTTHRPPCLGAASSPVACSPQISAEARVAVKDILESARALRDKGLSAETVVRVKTVKTGAFARYKVKSADHGCLSSKATRQAYNQQTLAAAGFADSSEARVTLGQLTQVIERKADALARITSQEAQQLEEAARANADENRANVTRDAVDNIWCTNAGTKAINAMIRDGKWQHSLGGKVLSDVMRELTQRHGPEMFATRGDLKHEIGYQCGKPLSEMLETRNNYYHPGHSSTTTYRGSAMSAALHAGLTAENARGYVQPQALFATDQGVHKATEFQHYHTSSARPHKVLYEVVGHSATKLASSGAALGEQEHLYSFDAVFNVVKHEQVTDGNSSYTRFLLKECSQDLAQRLRGDNDVVRIP